MAGGGDGGSGRSGDYVNQRNGMNPASACYAVVMHLGLQGVGLRLKNLDFTGVFADWIG